MAAERRAIEHPPVARVMILWQRPFHLSAEEAHDWASERVSCILRTGTVCRAELTPAQGPSVRYPADCDWILELDLGEGRSAHEFVDDPAAAAWLADLQQLGLQPRVIVVNGGFLLRPARD